MSSLKTIVVDDEIDAREGLVLLLSSQEDIDVVAVCQNGSEAVESILEHRPELVFLDIQMPGMTGFEVLEELSEKYLPNIIFCTAYDEYAVDAFEVHAIDYLLKPFSDERFYEALEHARKQLAKKDNEVLKTLLQPATAFDGIKNKLKIRASGGIHFLDYDEVIWVEGFDYYIKVHTENRFYLVRQSLKQMLETLPAQFIRIHKSSLINTDHLRSIEPLSRGNQEACLSNGQRLMISKTYRDIHSDLL